MMDKKVILNIVIPCYNEEKALIKIEKILVNKINSLISKYKISKESRIIFVNDGSKDKTWDVICSLHEKNPLFVGIKLSRNKGHQNALFAGLMYAEEHADVSISMDADLQDDVDAIDSMIEKYLEGNDIVYGVRNSRKKDSFFKRFTAEKFYKFMNIMGVDIVFNHADFRLMSKRALKGLAMYEEVNLFLRGIIPQIGYKSDVVYYERNKRVAGESKYPLRKMISFAFDGITSFSIKPIKFILFVGILFSILSFFVLLYCFIQKIMGNVVAGWTFIACSIWLLSGIQLISFGLIGEYIGKIYNETKKRPKYIIEDILE